MRFVASLTTALFCLVSGSQALQMILSSKEPQCLNIEPKRVGIKIDVSFTISGVNESEVRFTVSTSLAQLQPSFISPPFSLHLICHFLSLG